MLTTRESQLQGISVLIVEDEALVAMNLESMLEDLGCVVAGSATRLERALALLEHPPFPGMAILDVNLSGEKVFSVAERLTELSIPFLFATGYGAAAIPDAFTGWPVLQKPYSIADIERGLKEALGKEGTP